ncbi:MAG: FAD/NAD(P)-binding protein [Candidatus Baltobacteraceae bacterium]
MAFVRSYDTAVIGGGASGSSVLLALAQIAGPAYRAVLFEPLAPGPGIAYGAQPESLLMNGPARAMSIVPGDDGHLMRWLGNEPAHALISRKRYGEYVRQTMSAAFASTPSLTHRAAEIVDMESRDGGYRLTDRLGCEYFASSVVLALGNFAPADDFLPAEVRGHRGYCGNPWQIDVNAMHGDVAIVGSRLTAMDVAAQLDEKGFAGTIHMISRHGILPTMENSRIVGLDSASLALNARSPRALVRSMRLAVREHVARGGDWRSVVESIRPIASAIWVSWPLAEQQRFLRHLQPVWAACRYRVPVATYAAYQNLAQRGILRLIRGRITGARPSGENTLRMVISRPGDSTAIDVSTIVNATGPNANYATIGHPLVRNAMRRGLIRADDLRLGLDVTPELNCISQNGSPQPRLFTIGPALRGRFYETTAIPEIRAHAQHIAGALVALEVGATLGAVS